MPQDLYQFVFIDQATKNSPKLQSPKFGTAKGVPYEEAKRISDEVAKDPAYRNQPKAIIKLKQAPTPEAYSEKYKAYVIGPTLSTSQVEEQRNKRQAEEYKLAKQAVDKINKGAQISTAERQAYIRAAGGSNKVGAVNINGSTRLGVEVQIQEQKDLAQQRADIANDLFRRQATSQLAENITQRQQSVAQIQYPVSRPQSESLSPQSRPNYTPSLDYTPARPLNYSPLIKTQSSQQPDTLNKPLIQQAPYLSSQIPAGKFSSGVGRQFDLLFPKSPAVTSKAVQIASEIEKNPLKAVGLVGTGAAIALLPAPIAVGIGAVAIGGTAYQAGKLTTAPKEQKEQFITGLAVDTSLVYGGSKLATPLKKSGEFLYTSYQEAIANLAKESFTNPKTKFEYSGMAKPGDNGLDLYTPKGGAVSRLIKGQIGKISSDVSSGALSMDFLARPIEGVNIIEIRKLTQNKLSIELNTEPILGPRQYVSAEQIRATPEKVSATGEFFVSLPGEKPSVIPSKSNLIESKSVDLQRPSINPLKNQELGEQQFNVNRILTGVEAYRVATPRKSYESIDIQPERTIVQIRKGEKGFEYGTKVEQFVGMTVVTRGKLMFSPMEETTVFGFAGKTYKGQKFLESKSVGRKDIIKEYALEKPQPSEVYFSGNIITPKVVGASYGKEVKEIGLKAKKPVSIKNVYNIELIENPQPVKIQYGQFSGERKLFEGGLSKAQKLAAYKSIQGRRDYIGPTGVPKVFSYLSVEKKPISESKATFPKSFFLGKSGVFIKKEPQKPFKDILASAPKKEPGKTKEGYKEVITSSGQVLLQKLERPRLKSKQTTIQVKSYRESFSKSQQQGEQAFKRPTQKLYQVERIRLRRTPRQSTSSKFRSFAIPSVNQQTSTQNSANTIVPNSSKDKLYVGPKSFIDSLSSTKVEQKGVPVTPIKPYQSISLKSIQASTTTPILDYPPYRPRTKPPTNPPLESPKEPPLIYSRKITPKKLKSQINLEGAGFNPKKVASISAVYLNKYGKFPSLVTGIEIRPLQR